MREWADLHHHTNMSVMDGFGDVDTHVERCAERGHTAVAMTEHGTCRGFVALDAACKKHKIRPIYGCELYVTRDHRSRGLTPEQEASVTVGLKGKEATAAKKKLAKELGTKESRHLIALAGNEEGFRNLIRLTNTANRRGYYYRPKIDLDLLGKHAEGLWVNSGCVGSVVAQSILKGDMDRGLDDLEWFLDVFGGRFSLELQAHPLQIQEDWNKLAISLSEMYGIPLVVANDSHYPTHEDNKTHDAIVAIGHGRQLHDCDRMRYEADTFWLHDHDEMVEEFARHHPYIPRKLVLDGLERAAEIADQCRAELPRPSGVLLPKVTDDDPGEVLQDLCFDGWEWRDIDGRAKRRKVPTRDYSARLAHELKVIEGKGFAAYFLVVHEIVEWARGEGILVSCRGSAVGSLVCYLLGVTPIDPLEHGLLFERFLTPGRPDWPDVDLDVEDRRRVEIFDHLAHRYGADKVARIANVVRMAGRTAFRDAAKTHGVAYVEANAVSTAIVDPVTREDRTTGRDTVAEARASSATLQKFDDRHPGVLDLAEKIEGHVRHVGVHAAGVVCSPIPLDDFIPVERRLVNQQEIVVTAYDYRDCERVGLIKLDILGLTTLSVLADALRLIERRTGTRPDLESLPLDDEQILAAFTERDFLGVFQFGTPAAMSMSKDVQFRAFEDITALNAINRPGPAASGLADLWRDRNAGRDTDEGDPVIERICSQSRGVLVYQEQIMRILAEVAGFDPVEVGRIRKAVAKSKGRGYLEAERDHFVDGAVEVGGMSEGAAERLWSQIEQFGAYSFNLCVVGETKLLRAGANHYTGPELTVSKLFQIQSAKSPIGQKFRAGRFRILQMDEDGRIRPGLVKAVHHNGIQLVYRVKTKSGREIDATEGHQLLTDSGYKRVEEMEPGLCALVCLSAPEPGKRNEWRGKQAKGRKYGPRMGFPSGSENPGWKDGRTVLLAAAQDAVRVRANGACEKCGKTNPQTGFEFAHVESLLSLSNPADLHHNLFALYHSPGNLLHLCNPCHKKFDYDKGERKAAWSKGKPTELDLVVSVKFAGARTTYDVEMATPMHNYVANGIVSHNSHAAAYAAVAYWCQWVKIRYPAAFFCALLSNEQETGKAGHITREAARRGVPIEPPDINGSAERWSLRGGSLLAGLGGIKGIGEKACEELVAAQREGPFVDVPDLLSRVNRRRVNKTVLTALAKAGALRAIVPNTRWFLENLEQIGKLKGKKGRGKNARSWVEILNKLVAASVKEPEYTSEDLQALRLQVGVSLAEHPLDIVAPMLHTIGRQDPGPCDIDYAKAGSWVRGVVTSRKVASSRGEKWARLEIEDETGSRIALKFGDEEYKRFRPVIDLGLGAVVAAWVTVTKSKYGVSARAALLVDLLGMRERWRAGEELTWQEASFCRGEMHPLSGYPGHFPESMAWYNNKRAPVLVLSRRVKRDRAGQRMAWVRVDPGVPTGIDEFVVFGSMWGDVSKAMQPGRIVRVYVKKDGKGRKRGLVCQKVW